MKNVMMEEYMEQNPPVQDQSFKSDREPEEEAEDAALWIDEEDSWENLENHLIPEPQQLSLSKTMQIDTGEPLAKKPQLYEDFLASRKTAKALSELLGTTKDVMLYEKLKKMQQKIQAQDITKNNS